MKKIDLSDKKLSVESIQTFFARNEPGALAQRFHIFETFAEWEQLYVDSIRALKSNQHKRVSYNFIVNLCSTLEIYLKELVANNGNHWNKRNYAELLSEKVSLENAYRLFKEAKLTREVIISRFSNFTSFDGILRTLTKLTTDQFVQELEIFPIFEKNPANLITCVPDWQPSISLLISERHKIIHEGMHTMEDISEESIRRLGFKCFMFMYAVDAYCTSRNFTL